MVTRTNQVQDQDKSNKRFSLIGDINSRNYLSSTYDQRIYNMYVEIEKDTNTKEERLLLVKRPGCSLVANIKTPPAGELRGMYYWKGKFYIIFGSQIWNSTGAGGTLHATTLGSSTGYVGFSEYDNGTNQYLIMCDGTSAYYIADGSPPTITIISDAQFPSSPIPTPVAMDGYVFIAKQGTGDIYNSDLNSPSSWSSQLIRTELYPDNVRALKKHLNQIVAFGEYSTEFFYDAGNVSSSPLSRNEGTSYQMGTCAPYAIVGTERYLIFPSQAKNGGRAIHMFNGFQLEKISTNFIERTLDAFSTTQLNSARAYTIRSNGHLFYVIYFGTATFAYDIETKYWSRWSWNNNGSHATWLFGYVADDGGGTPYGVNASDGNLYLISPTAYTDNTIGILCDIYTRPYDGENWNRKFNHGVYLIADKPGGFYTTSAVQLRWSDDDYQTWSNFRTALLNSRCFFPRLGSFRRRAFNILMDDDGPYRVEALEFTDMQTGHN